METLNLFDLFARITLDTSDYDSGLDEAGRNTESFADKLKTGLTTAAKVGAAALAAAATGVAALTKSSIDQYAEYEQLVGGVDTLFKDASDTIQQYASNAYKTAGVAANTYMEQATAFSASLIQSLGGDTQAAAEYANQAIMDMSDNANKMGTDIESIQQTYQSLMRGNYAMLDNLKLGYGGTKSELERLVADAEELTGQALDPDKFSDVITAIHAVQENMGITGTTAAEAATTIEGSVGMMRAAWSNLMTGIADENADLDTLIGNFVTSVETAAGNIIPRVTQILSGMGAAIEQLAPILAAEVPGLITSVLPSLVSAGAQLLAGLATGLVSATPQLVSSIPGIMSSVVAAFAANGPALMAAGQQLMDMVSNGIVNGFPAILENGTQILTQLIDGITGAIPNLIASLPAVIMAIVEFIADNLPRIVESGVDILMHLITGLISAIPSLVAVLPQIINAIVNGIGSLMGSVVEAGKNIVEGIWEGISGAAEWLKEKVTGFFSGIVDGAKDLLGIHSPSTVFADMGRNMALGMGEGWDSEFSKIKDQIEGGMNFGMANVDFASSGLGMASAGMVNGIASAVSPESSGSGPVTINLVLPDGTKFASWQLPFLINAGRAAGTPIANPQVG